jgi:hypothetical protein
MKQTIFLSITALFSLVLAGCGGGGGSAPTPTPTPNPTPTPSSAITRELIAGTNASLGKIWQVVSVKGSNILYNSPNMDFTCPISFASRTGGSTASGCTSSSFDAYRIDGQARLNGSVYDDTWSLDGTTLTRTDVTATYTARLTYAVTYEGIVDGAQRLRLKVLSDTTISGTRDINLTGFEFVIKDVGI